MKKKMLAGEWISPETENPPPMDTHPDGDYSMYVPVFNNHLCTENLYLQYSTGLWFNSNHNAIAGKGKFWTPRYWMKVYDPEKSKVTGVHTTKPKMSLYPKDYDNWDTLIKCTYTPTGPYGGKIHYSEYDVDYTKPSGTIISSANLYEGVKRASLYQFNQTGQRWYEMTGWKSDEKNLKELFQKRVKKIEPFKIKIQDYQIEDIIRTCFKMRGVYPWNPPSEPSGPYSLTVDKKYQKRIDKTIRLSHGIKSLNKLGREAFIILYSENCPDGVRMFINSYSLVNVEDWKELTHVEKIHLELVPIDTYCVRGENDIINFHR